MKKSTLSILAIIVIVVIAGFVWKSRSGDMSAQSSIPGDTSTPPVAASETTKVSDKVSEYQSSELGFSVKYPTAWEREETNAGVTFILPIDKTQVSTIATLQANIQVLAGTCAFPPVTSVKDRGTITSGDNTFNTVSMSNIVQGRTYFNRMYSLQKGSVCYMFSFASISLAPSSKKLTGSQATQAENNNKAVVADADAAFTTMVKSFAFVVQPAGKDETQAAPAK